MKLPGIGWIRKIPGVESVIGLVSKLAGKVKAFVYEDDVILANTLNEHCHPVKAPETVEYNGLFGTNIKPAKTIESLAKPTEEHPRVGRVNETGGPPEIGS